MDHGTWNMEVCNYGTWNVGYSREGFSNFNSCSYCFELVLVKLKQITLVHTGTWKLWYSKIGYECPILIIPIVVYLYAPKHLLDPKYI